MKLPSYVEQAQKQEAKQREAMRQTPAGKLLVRYGFEPYNIESCTRLVAEKAAEEIEALKAAAQEKIKTLEGELIGARAGFATESTRADRLIAAAKVDAEKIRVLREALEAVITLQSSGLGVIGVVRAALEVTRP